MQQRLYQLVDNKNRGGAFTNTKQNPTLPAN